MDYFWSRKRGEEDEHTGSSETGIRRKKCIERELFENKTAYRELKIRPTNSSESCIAYTFDKNGKEVNHCKMWSPTADDLMADDWIVSN